MTTLDLKLMPPPPLGARPALWIVGGTGLVMLLASARFIALGAWPILPFLGVDLAGPIHHQLEPGLRVFAETVANRQIGGLIVDGGKGQLSRAVEVLTEFDLLGKVPVMGLAKQEEELFVPGRERSVLLPRHSQGLYLVQRIRDEAHRFAITAHRNKRSKAGIASRLDSVKGIGPAKRKALLAKFGDIEGILNATIEELATVKGINAELANSIKMQLN